jgi:hypothetical protein
MIGDEYEWPRSADPRWPRPGDPDVTEGMMSPVRCTHCGGVYDLGMVEVTARYADCSVWKTPCCGATVDDRGETGWKSRSDYTRIPKGR